jgi:ATP-dependent DNA ligase
MRLRVTDEEPASPPTWVKPQLAKLVEKAPVGPDWLHEIKFDGYRMHARLDAGRAQVLTRRGLDWTDKYPAIANAIAGLPAHEKPPFGDVAAYSLAFRAPRVIMPRIGASDKRRRG